MLTSERYPYRIFLSYSREDFDYAARISDRLRTLKVKPVWDRDNSAGWPFLDQIKKRIAYSHLFIPLLTSQSAQSSWVNHEIGYAIGRNVPVLPLSLGRLPEGMAAGVQAESDEHIEGLLERLTHERIDRLVRKAQSIAMYECADLVEQRTEAIISCCNDVEAFISQWEQRLRHSAAFGSFSIPLEPDDPAWSARYHDQTPPSRHRIELLVSERRLLEEYAFRFGCDLVLYPSLSKFSKIATNARVQILKCFLSRAHDVRADVRVVFDDSVLGHNLLILGDWFLAESMTPKVDGYRHTTITHHAPTVLKRLEEINLRFQRSDGMSAERAIHWLDDHFS